MISIPKLYNLLSNIPILAKTATTTVVAAAAAAGGGIDSTICYQDI
jgi:hypothetical protein